MDQNPLLSLGLRVPFDAIEATHVKPAIESLIAGADERLEAVRKLGPGEYSFSSVMETLESSTEDLSFAMTVVAHLESVATSPQLREAYGEVQPLVSAFYAKIPLDAALWSAIKGFADTDEAHELDPVRARLLAKTVDEFRRHGADLPDDRKAELEAVEVELATTTKKFAENVLDATNDFELVITDEEGLSGLPESARQAAKADAQSKELEGWRFTLHGPSYVPLMTYLDDRNVREQVWRAYNTRATRDERDNGALIGRILELRQRKAKLLGYADFADFALEDRMAHDGAKASAFLADLEGRSREASAAEHKALASYRRELEGSDAPELAPWDVGYYAEKLRRERYDFDEEALRPYFPLEKVLSGMFDVVERLYGVEVKPVDDVPTWHETVRVYALEEKGRRIGVFHADLFPRETKRGGAWMHGMLVGREDHEGREHHLGIIAANVTLPVGDTPSLLTHREVETLFHEFGHLLHHMLTRVEIRSMAGTNVAWDFVELPSQIMENWCWEREALDLFARHHETDEPLPDELFQKMRKARTFRAATGMMRQLSFGTLDLHLHRAYAVAPQGPVLEVAREVMQRFTGTPLPEDYAMVCGFTHLFASSTGYAAGYYSYKWAEVLDADAFTAFLEAGVFDRDVGTRFREVILARGDSQDPEDLYREFMGREPDLQPLLVRSGLAPEAA